MLAPAYYAKVRYCERCRKDLLGLPPAMRAVHHKDHNRKHNEERNFELLCKRCHQVEHECWRNLPNNRRE
ncbi:HNH endonuclease [Xanthomonas translucens]|uniref:HNH endonuclease n=1 Tax=Xanthomonas campestris pv. translucens TaxID=343 RepID=UPI003CCE815A